MGDEPDMVEDAAEGNRIVATGTTNETEISIELLKDQHKVQVFADSHPFFHKPDRTKTFDSKEEAREFFEELKEKHELTMSGS